MKNFNEKLSYCFFILCILFVAVISFSKVSCTCSRTNGICTVRSYAYFIKQQDSFNIKDLKKVDIVYSGGKGLSYRIVFCTDYNGIEYSIKHNAAFFAPWGPNIFAKKLLAYKNNVDKDFSYIVFTIFIFPFIFIFLYSFTCFLPSGSNNMSIRILIALIFTLILGYFLLTF